MSTISANDHGPCTDPRPAVASVDIQAYRVFLNLPEMLHRQMAERARATAQSPATLYQSALIAFGRNLDCGVRLPLSGAAPDDVGVFVQLPADLRRWLRRLASRLSLSESDIVTAAASWLLTGGAAPTPRVVYDRSQQPLSTHDPPG